MSSRASMLALGRSVVLLAFLLASQAVPAMAQPDRRPRIVDLADDSRRVVLQGNRHPLARAEFDRGAAPPDLPMSRMLLVLRRGPEENATLDRLLDEQQDRSSAHFHEWL